MTVYGITRASTRKQQASPEVQAKMIREQCAAAQLPEPVKEGKGTGNGFEWYWRATRWFHRMKHAGKLPPPYCDTAHTIPETKLFTVEKRPQATQRQTRHRRKSRLDGRAVARVVWRGVCWELTRLLKPGFLQAPSRPWLRSYGLVLSISPTLMPNWQAIESVPVELPFGHKAIHQGDEAAVVSGFQQVDHFMHDDVFQALARLFRQIGVEPDACGRRDCSFPIWFSSAARRTVRTFTPMSGSHFAIR